MEHGNAFQHLRLHLEARDPARNVARRYWIETSEDLFGAIIVDYAWGAHRHQGSDAAGLLPNRS